MSDGFVPGFVYCAPVVCPSLHLVPIFITLWYLCKVFGIPFLSRHWCKGEKWNQWALFSSSLSSIGVTWNLTWPFTSLDLGGHPSRYAFRTRLRSSLIPPKFELDPSNLKFDLTFDLTWPGRGSWAQSEQPEIWPDLWPLMTFWPNRPLPPTTMSSFISIGRKGAKRIAGQTDRHTPLL